MVWGICGKRSVNILEVEVARDKTLYSQSFKRGRPIGQLSVICKTANRRGTFIDLHLMKIFWRIGLPFKPETLYQDGSFKGLSVCWS